MLGREPVPPVTPWRTPCRTAFTTNLAFNFKPCLSNELHYSNPARGCKGTFTAGAVFAEGLGFGDTWGAVHERHQRHMKKD